MLVPKDPDFGCSSIIIIIIMSCHVRKCMDDNPECTTIIIANKNDDYKNVVDETPYGFIDK